MYQTYLVRSSAAVDHFEKTIPFKGMQFREGRDSKKKTV